MRSALWEKRNKLTKRIVQLVYFVPTGFYFLFLVFNATFSNISAMSSLENLSMKPLAIDMTLELLTTEVSHGA
jgi:hypothetical protein